jgi:YegS/Rv2252/BmrU family lipid kinase
LVLVNPKSGITWSFAALRRALDEHWDVNGVELVYQFTQTQEDGIAKARRAVDRGFEAVLVVGGDGTVSTIGRALIGTDATLGVIPVGSGNGLARHFGIPMSPARAVAALAGGSAHWIDVGCVNDLPFLVTCSMAWDAAIVRSFNRYPLRGIVPYVFAGVQEFFEYQPQDMTVRLDSGEEIVVLDPLVFTVANLTQYGGGARIAPHAKPDDGHLELVTARRQDIALLLANVRRFFDGTVDQLPEVTTRRFERMEVRRDRPAPIQVDGELVEAPARLEVHVRPRALRIIVPAAAGAS